MTNQAHDDLLATILEDLRAECVRGQIPDIDSKAAAHPSLATELRQLWATIEFLEELTPKNEKPLDHANSIHTDTSEKFPRTFGNYELLKVLGRGGMGVVYKARQRSLNRIVALKMIRKGENASPEELARFQAEALVASRIVHANVVPVLDAGTIDNQPFFVMLYLEGETLAQRLVREPLRQDEAARIVALLARAIHSAHLTGLLHRDLKPSNIIFNRAGVPHVSDFGLAKVFNNGAGTEWQSNHPATVSGTILGTPGYMAPEQVSRAYGEAGPGSDVYALGAILYEMLAGRPPFRAATAMETLLLVLDQEPVRPAILSPLINPDLELICLKCLQKRPDMRYLSAEELAVDLESWREHGPLSVRVGGWRGIAPLMARVFRETQHAAILENWGLLWMWHGAMILALCMLTWTMALTGFDRTWALMALWGGGLALWGAISWKLRTRGGPVFFIERQVAHLWAGAVLAVIGIFLTEMILQMDALQLSPILAVITGMMFVTKAGMLSGEFYIYAALNFIAIVPMTISMNMQPTWHLNQIILAVVASLGFIIPGARYHQQRRKALRASNLALTGSIPNHQTLPR